MKSNRRNEINNRITLLGILGLTQLGLFCSSSIVYASDKPRRVFTFSQEDITGILKEKKHPSSSIVREENPKVPKDPEDQRVKKESKTVKTPRGQKFQKDPRASKVQKVSKAPEALKAPEHSEQTVFSPVEVGRGLIEATKNLKLEQVGLWLTRSPQQSDLDQALLYAARTPRSNALPIVTLLIEYGAKIVEIENSAENTSAVSTRDGRAKTALHQAVKTGSLEVIKFLVESVDKKFLVRHWSDIMISAATFHNVDVFRYLWKEFVNDFDAVLEEAAMSVPHGITSQRRLPIYNVLKAAAARTKGRPIYVMSMFKSLPHRRMGNLLLKYIVEDRDEIFGERTNWDNQELWDIIKAKGFTYFSRKEEVSTYKKKSSSSASSKEEKQMLVRLTMLGLRESDDKENKTDLGSAVSPAKEDKKETLDCKGRRCKHAPMLESAVFFGDSEEVRELINLHNKPSSVATGVKNIMRERLGLNFDRAYWNDLLRRLAVLTAVSEFPQNDIFKELLVAFPDENISQAQVLEILKDRKSLVEIIHEIPEDSSGASKISMLLDTARTRVEKSAFRTFDRSQFIQGVLFPIVMRNSSAGFLLHTFKDIGVGFPTFSVSRESSSDCIQTSSVGSPAVVVPPVVMPPASSGAF